MSRKKKLLLKPKSDEYVTLAVEALKTLDQFDYTNYDQERNTVIVSRKMHEKINQLIRNERK